MESVTEGAILLLLFTVIIGLIFSILIHHVRRRKRKKMDTTSQVVPDQRYSAAQPEVVIVGSGVVGSALAATLGAEGRYVSVIERDLSEPDRIVGELLQPGGCQALKQLGLQDCLEGIDAQTVLGYMVEAAGGTSEVHAPYPHQGAPAAQASGRAFHHGRFVQALRQAARKHSSVQYREGTVTSLLETTDGQVEGVIYKDKASGITQEIHAPLTVVADGCFSRFRKHLVKIQPNTASHFVGLLMKDCPQRRRCHAEVVLTCPSPVLVYRVCETYTRVLVDIQGNMPRDLKGYMQENILPQLPEHLQGPFERAVNEERMRTMPNSFLPSAPVLRPGVLCLGDALNMRHPLTGGGMTVGLDDVVLLRDLLLRQVKDFKDANAVMGAAGKIYRHRKQNHSFVVNVLSMALYRLFSANDDNLGKLKEACFEYLKLGGHCIAGPVALLSVLKPRPHLLLAHFFAVAFYAVYRNFREVRWWAAPRALMTSSAVLVRACSVIFPLIWSERYTLFLT